MKLLSYLDGGRPSFGAVNGDRVVPLAGRLRSGATTLREALAADAIAEMKDVTAATKETRPLAELRLLPVIPNPDKILCVGINYRSHAAEMSRALPPQPSVFARLVNTLVGHDGEMLRPRISDHFDFEGELAVIIGRPGRNIAREHALDYVAGYSCFVDGSVRDFQKHSVTAGKNFPATGPLGPWLVTADEVGDPQALTLTTRLNGREVQHSGTDQMIYPVAEIVSYVSRFTRLLPGDVIATGTPEGVGHGRTPPLWMKSGDILDVEISRIGTLRARIADEPA